MYTNDPPYVVVMTSDKYIDAVRPYSYLLNKYWVPNPRVFVMGFTPPSFKLPENFSFHSLGNFSDYPFDKWSNALHKAMEIVPDEVAVIMLEDYWITRQVDTRAVKILYDYMRQFRYVIKMDLYTDRLYAFGADLNYGHVAYIDLVKSMPGSPYHFSWMTGLWRKEHLLRHAPLNESPHQMELVGSTRLSHDQNVLVLGTRNCPIRHTLAFRGNDPKKLLLDELDKSDIDQLRSMGYLRPWEGNQ